MPSPAADCTSPRTNDPNRRQVLGVAADVQRPTQIRQLRGRQTHGVRDPAQCEEFDAFGQQLVLLLCQPSQNDVDVDWCRRLGQPRGFPALVGDLRWATSGPEDALGVREAPCTPEWLRQFVHAERGGMRHAVHVRAAVAEPDMVAAVAQLYDPR